MAAARYRSEEYRQHVREHGCLICGYPANAHHMRVIEKGGMGLKVGDNNCVPLCHDCHHGLHRSGLSEGDWWAIQGVDPVAWIEQNWKAYHG